MTYPTAASADERRASRFFPRRARMRGLGAALFVAAALMVVAASPTAAKSAISVAGFATVDGGAVVGGKVALYRGRTRTHELRGSWNGARVSSSGAFMLQTGTAMGSLTFEAVLAMTSTPGPCPPGSPPDADFCAARTGGGAVRGLGRVSETYPFFVQEGDCDRSIRDDSSSRGRRQGRAPTCGRTVPGGVRLVVVEPEPRVHNHRRLGYLCRSLGRGRGESSGLSNTERLSRDGHVDRHAECARAGIRCDAAHAQGRRQQDSSGPEGVEARARDLQGHRQRCRRRFGPGVLPAEVGQSLQNRSHLREVLGDGHERERADGKL